MTAFVLYLIDFARRALANDNRLVRRLEEGEGFVVDAILLETGEVAFAIGLIRRAAS